MLTRKFRLSMGLAVVLVCASFASGCALPLPVRPLLHEPISVTVVNDQISWVQCLGHDIDVYYVSTSVREEAGNRREWALLTAEGSKGDAVSVPSGEPIDLGSSFQGLPVLDSNDVRASSLTDKVTIYLVLASTSTRVEMAFKGVDAESLTEGKYVYYSGEVSDEPCGMSND